MSASSLMLHACCAPCAAPVIEYLTDRGERPLVFFSNSNIDTREEYDRRFAELGRYCDALGVELVDDGYDHQAWLDAVKGLENEPERGARCLRCFRFRLERAAAFARERGCTLLTTSLAQSRWKSLEQVNEAGSAACGDSPRWWNANWRKGGLQPRRSELIREWNFYNQPYCGCEFSKRHLQHDGN